MQIKGSGSRKGWFEKMHILELFCIYDPFADSCIKKVNASNSMRFLMRANLSEILLILFGKHVVLFVKAMVRVKQGGGVCFLMLQEELI